MLKLFSHCKWSWKQLAALLVLVLLSSVGQMLLPSLLAQMIHRGVTANQSSAIFLYGALMVVSAVCSCVISFCSVRLASQISTEAIAQLREEVFAKLQSFSSVEMDQFGTASLVTRSTSDMTHIQNFLTMFLRIGLLAPLMGASGLVFSAMTGGKVTSVLLISVPVLLIVLGILVALASLYSIRLRKKLDQINRIFLESLEGVRVIRGFHKQEAEMERLECANRDYTMTALASGRVTSLLMPGITVIFGMTTVAVLGLGAYDVESGAMEVGSLVANSQYISLVLTAVMMLSLVIMMFPTSCACAKRIAQIFDTEPSIRDGKADLSQRTMEATVEFRHVTFAYPGAEEPVLKDVSFRSGPGEITAILGGTGSGKSSILKLIPRLYDPSFGEIWIDGVPAKDYTLTDLRSLIGYVPQKHMLFSGDIGSNLQVGREDGERADWERAARMACAEEFIQKKPEGYDSPVAQGGTNLSGGQRQRLAIARAMMKQPEIYLLDDSFSALDMKTDRQVRQNLKEGMGNATVILVAQRISTILDADRILVMEQGKIVGMGTHQELLHTCPLYREIANLQLGQEETQ